MAKQTAAAFEPAMFRDALDRGHNRLEAIAEVQKEVFQLYEDAGRRWQDRLKQEADLTKQLTQEMSTCKSVPEMMAKYQEWLGQHMELIAADSQNMISDSQKLMAACARMMSGSGAGK